jgi:hypothetical protein
MVKDLICPLGNNCKVYHRWDPKGNEERDKVIKDGLTGYYCHVLRETYKGNFPLTSDIDGKECVLIKVLNNSEALLKLSGKGKL